jgi:hypothetical protein
MNLILYFALQSTFKMESNKDYLGDLKAIRSIMERSSRFISLSGMSGVLAGLFSIAGGIIVYNMLGNKLTLGVISGTGLLVNKLFTNVMMIALAVLFLTIFTGIWLSYRKAIQQHQAFWASGSKQFLFSLLIPLIAGGLFILIFAMHGYYELIIPSCLIFYGISLVQGARYTISGIQWLGYAEILLALICASYSGYDLLFWFTGFGILHLIYGIVMSIRYGL